MRESTLDKVSCELKVCLQQLTKKKNEMERLEAELERFRSKCSQSELQIKANKAVINKLNEQRMFQAEAMETVKSRLADEAKAQPQPELTNSYLTGKDSTRINQNGIHLLSLREVEGKKSSRSTAFAAKNVDFLLDEEDYVENSRKAKPHLEDDGDFPNLFQHDILPKNHLFPNTKERPKFREVNLRTSNKTKSGPSNSTNVMTASSKRTSMF